MKTQKETVKPTNKWWFAIYIGFYAGLIWGALKIVEHYFQFTELTPGFLIEPFFKHAFLLTWQGLLVGWLFFIIFSIIASLIYAVAMAKAKGPWPGAVYGIAWWALLYLILGPASGMMSSIGRIEWNTLITDGCLFVLWGLFIGYSITLEFTDERVREPGKKGIRSRPVR
ncbi:YqhR family membrane protein [Paenibacillus thalictri]|uniref:Membrane protein YqhR n=1 Tax=Paenibacillus thalictri TaxID=2527873 RepID=A0A4Q9DSR5_9BACL|nr:YqhR family membrane protein [Paenibacillus thalictri]TBL79909.1 hypothetical protein EYB31_09975 [Paenibacillus thalictri]